MPEHAQMTYREAEELAEKLEARNGSVGQWLGNAATEVATMELECRTAARLIRALLRQVHASDVFRLPPEE